MKVYIVLAHPERRSFNAALADVYRSTLEADGHHVRFRDLHADGFNPLLTRADFEGYGVGDLVQFPNAQSRAWSGNKTAADIAIEHNSLTWADAVILQFPLWLYGLPAMLKGWCERVLSEGVAHRPAENIWFENGGFSGTRIMLSLTTNGRRETYAHNGRHGSLDIILWPIANALRFSGFDLVEPFIAFDVVRVSDSDRREILGYAANRARSMLDLDLMPFHALTDYSPNGVLKDDVQPATPGQQRPDNCARC